MWTETYTKVQGQYKAAERDGKVLSYHGRCHHPVPGESVDQPAHGAAQDHQGQAANQTICSHQLETLTTDFDKILNNFY